LFPASVSLVVRTKEAEERDPGNKVGKTLVAVSQ